MIVFVHGVPETAGIWDAVRARIDAPSTALALPGFGCDRPDGFAATKDAYVEWLAEALAAVDEPVDLVGHDWGAGLTYRIATAHGDLVRSWAADVGNIAHPDYEWHDFAKLWQTPGDGEAFFEAQNAAPVADRAATYESMGVATEYATEMAEAGDDTMASCILDLYRSALPNVHADWGPWEPTAAPGLVLHSSDDAFSDQTQAGEVAAALGAGFAVIPGSGHFWPSEAPEAGARALTDFWASLT